MKKTYLLIASLAISVFSIQVQAQCNATQTFNYTGALQTFVVPAGVTTVTVECYGAKGGNGNQPSSLGGNGAYIKGDVTVTPGETLNIIAGGMGVSGVASLEGGGGGGGSFVIRATGNVPLVIAGGGGGGSYQASTSGTGGSASTTGNAGGYVPTLPGQGGFSDNGGGGGTGAGGGGWNANGSSNMWATGGTMQGGAGGVSSYIGNGGFGGGGAAYHGGGGGGGYSGGGGGTYTIGGGGAGSYNTGTNQTNTASVNSGNGYVVLTYASVYNTTVSETICFGADYTFPDGSTQTGITAQVVQTSTLTAVIGGCDSIVETTVDVFPLIDNGVSSSGLTITADAATGTYQWLMSSDNCVTFSVITGETNQSFTATADGDYAVVVSENGCSDTSVCTNITYFGMNELAGDVFSIFPNPANDLLYVKVSDVSADGQIEIISITGALITTVKMKGSQTTIELDELNAGIYFVRLKYLNGETSATQKLIVQ